eukprot:3378111-Lingulodinium_polyedra.AAC.1
MRLLDPEPSAANDLFQDVETTEVFALPDLSEAELQKVLAKRSMRSVPVSKQVLPEDIMAEVHANEEGKEPQ